MTKKKKSINSNGNAFMDPNQKNDNVDINNNYCSSNNMLSNKLSRSLNNEKQINNKISQKEMSLVNSKKKSSSIYDPLETKVSFNKYENSNNLFPYSFYLIDFFYNNSINPKKYICISKKYFIVYKFMCHLYDVSTHIMLFKQFNILYNFISSKICEERDNTLYEYYLMNKINIGDSHLMEKLGNSLNNKKSILYSNFFYYQ